MPSLHELQSTFLDFLLEGSGGCEGLVADDARVGRARRLAIYANAYRLRLREAIETDHPALGAYLGDELFDRMVHGYVRAHPSRGRSLRHFADSLPGYLAGTPPFDGHPQIAELAAFERVMLDAFDAPEAPRRSLSDLIDLEAGAWPGMGLRLHPSCRVFRPQWNAVEIWKAIKAGTVPPDPAPVAHAWLVWRGTDRLTHFVPLGADGLYMLEAMADGAAFASACEGLLRWHDESAVSAAALGHLSSWLGHGLVSEVYPRR
ncbi:MAG: DNA-binding domain-containing protein [Chromatiales bacterium]|jgi:hypothetical protein